MNSLSEGSKPSPPEGRAVKLPFRCAVAGRRRPGLTMPSLSHYPDWAQEGTAWASGPRAWGLHSVVESWSGAIHVSPVRNQSPTQVPARDASRARHLAGIGCGRCTSHSELTAMDHLHARHSEAAQKRVLNFYGHTHIQQCVPPLVGF